MPRHAHGLHQVVDRAGRHALDVGLLDHRSQRLLGHPPRLQEAREVSPLPQLRDLQLDRAAARVGEARTGRGIAVAVGRYDPPSARRERRRSGPRPPVPCSRTAVKPIISRSRSASELFSKSDAQGHHVRGHRGSPSGQVGAATTGLLTESFASGRMVLMDGVVNEKSDSRNPGSRHRGVMDQKKFGEQAPRAGQNLGGLRSHLPGMAVERGRTAINPSARPDTSSIIAHPQRGLLRPYGAEFLAAQVTRSTWAVFRRWARKSETGAELLGQSA